MMLCFILISFFIHLLASKTTQSSDLNIHRIKRQFVASRVSCILPSHPENGRWVTANKRYKPGDRIQENTFVKFDCNEGYMLDTSKGQPAKYVFCDKNWDLFRIPKCEKLCPPLSSNSKTTLKCVNKIGNEIDCSQATDGVQLFYNCAPLYETSIRQNKALSCVNGTWDSPPPVCRRECGKKLVHDNSILIIGGQMKETIEYPWVAAIFSKVRNNFSIICGGTIISSRMVITAAHCVTNGYGDILPKKNFRIGGGKLYNRYNDSRDSGGQYLEVFQIIVHPGYRGESRRFQADIALVITKDPFVLTEFVQPACFYDVNNVTIGVGNVGIVAGWGLTEDGLVSEKLKTLEIPYKQEDTCIQELPKWWVDKYVMMDKICAGLYNKSSSVCQGDSGGGLIFNNPEDDRYYLHGIVSLAPTINGQCNIQQNSLYTGVAFHYDFLTKEINKFFVEHCILPPYPPNGRWTIDEGGKISGDVVATGTVLKYTCNKGFRLSSSSLVGCDSLRKPICTRFV